MFNSPLDTGLKCPKCNASIQNRIGIRALFYVCPTCKSSIELNLNKPEVRKTFGYSPVVKPKFALGAKAKIKGKPYQVVGILICAEKKAYSVKWREYVLHNPDMGFCFLSEFDGHWNLIEEINGYKSGPYARAREYGGKKYELFSDYGVDYIYAEGEFFWDINKSGPLVLEYISPPHSLLREKSDSEVTWFQATYLEPKEIREMFGLKSAEFLPSRVGVYSNQNSAFQDVRSSLFRLLGLFFALFIVIQLILISFNEEKLVLDTNYELDSAQVYANKAIVTEPFDLKNSYFGTNSLSIALRAPVKNTWFEIGGVLTNEDTGEEFSFEQGVEYYSGVEGGYSWAEGAQLNEIILSEIPDGTYRLTITTYQDNAPALPLSYSFAGSEEKPQPRVGNFAIAITKGVTLISNFWILFFAALVIPVFILFRINYVHESRWANSNVISNN